MDATTVCFLPRREGEREGRREGRREGGRKGGKERTREGERLSAWDFMPRRAGPGSGPSVLCGLQECCRAVAPEGREPQGDPGLLFPAGRPVFADIAQELMVENLFSSRDFLNWHFITLTQAKIKDVILILKGFFFFSYLLSPFLEQFYCCIDRKAA